MMLAKFRQDTADRKRYVINYADWLNTGEKVLSTDVTGSVPEDNFYVDGYTVSGDGLEVYFFVSGGSDRESYDVTLTTTTTLGQIKQDYVTFVVTD